VIPNFQGGVQLIGGYPSGQIQDPQLADELERDAIENRVVLSGDRDHNDPATDAGLAAIFDAHDFDPITSLYADNVYHVVKAVGVSSATVLDGLTIRGGHADGFETRGNGAGIYLADGTPTIQSCTIEFNRAKVSTLPPDFFTQIDGSGGGVYSTDGDLLRIRDTTFRYNQARVGGGLYKGPTQTPWPSSDLEIIGCTFVQNRLFSEPVGSSQQTPNVRGGGVFCERGTGSILILGCRFLHNTADSSSGSGGASGGALNISTPPHCEGAACSSTACYECSKPACSSSQPAYCPTHVFIVGSLFSGNTGRTTAGGSIRTSRKAVIEDCTIAWNELLECVEGDATAGVVAGHQAFVTVENSILWDNHMDSACGSDLHPPRSVDGRFCPLLAVPDVRAAGFRPQLSCRWT
jgi:hypothetical protein